ncbi:MAG: lysophospholipid acyltransferase family protein [Pseudomonas sp.]|uniref:lysophospholipid acyltransferase family protein n=1 Tax=Pseudomonas sp. MYb185 TaxID=1848729 RepID=UPI000CFE01E1|nr:lysophospholipid acyltransferase family protein [Pseudomonas sp. MYb185]PRB82806.1 1-acyl-sn-glycerol-3-phosphate acyltransferase [Pseudomonas sp. MYb185]
MSVLMVLRVTLFYLLLSSSAMIWGMLMLLIGPFLSYRTRYKVVLEWWCRMAIWLTEHLVGIRYEVSGQENIPDQAGVILSNHQSTWETFFLQQIFRPQTQLIKKELLYVPFFGWAFALLKPIAINRSKARSSLQQLNRIGGERLRDGVWVLVFPEGTRVLPGQPIKFTRGGSALACANNAPVVPVAHNAGEFWPRHGWGKRPGTVQVKIGPAIYPKGQDPRSIVEVNRQAEAWVQQAMREMQAG